MLIDASHIIINDVPKMQAVFFAQKRNTKLFCHFTGFWVVIELRLGLTGAKIGEH